MSDVERNIETLIVRALDKEISDDEQLALNRELIRNPAAQRLMEEYRRVDELTAAALGDALETDRLPLDPESLPDQHAMPAAGRPHRGWWLVPGAVAAALLAIFVARMPIGSSDARIADNPSVHTSIPIPVISGPVRPNNGIMRNAATGPQIKRSAGKDVFGVMGDDGNIYWIEVDRIWTLKRARPGTVLGRQNEEL